MWTESIEILNPYEALKEKKSIISHNNELEYRRDKTLKIQRALNGDIWFMADTTKTYNLGEQYKDCTNLKVIGRQHKYKPWYKFWKKKEIVGYYIMVEGVK